jgi:hypothetical protein
MTRTQIRRLEGQKGAGSKARPPSTAVTQDVLTAAAGLLIERSLQIPGTCRDLDTLGEIKKSP